MAILGRFSVKMCLPLPLAVFIKLKLKAFWKVFNDWKSFGIAAGSFLNFPSSSTSRPIWELFDGQNSPGYAYGSFNQLQGILERSKSVKIFYIFIFHTKFKLVELKKKKRFEAFIVETNLALPPAVFIKLKFKAF